jgi:hypothetical protein
MYESLIQSFNHITWQLLCVIFLITFFMVFSDFNGSSVNISDSFDIANFVKYLRYGATETPKEVTKTVLTRP